MHACNNWSKCNWQVSRGVDKVVRIMERVTYVNNELNEFVKESLIHQLEFNQINIKIKLRFKLYIYITNKFRVLLNLFKKNGRRKCSGFINYYVCGDLNPFKSLKCNN